MGKFRSRLKGQSKGKRWPKGQSSNSNPETRKYRDLAKSRFFQENLGPSTLTSDALKRHDAVQAFLPKPEKMDNVSMDEDVVSSVTSDGSYHTMKSFASEWSDCSNMSYSRFLKVFRSDSALHKEMLAILAAIAEVIKENGGTESPTEYYCALLTTLEQVYNQEERKDEQVTAVLSLINMGIKTVPEGVLKNTFNDVSMKMMQILNDYVDSDNNTIIKSVFGILSALLKTQELAVWMNSSNEKIFNSILNPFCIHNKPKWRKAAQQAVTLVVKTNCFAESNFNPAANLVAAFCKATLDRCMGGSSGEILVSSVQAGQTTILHTLGLMKETICNFSKSHIKNCCETLLRLITLKYPLVTSCSLQTLHALFSSQRAVVPAQLNGQLISALYELQPSTADVRPTLAWLAVMQQAHVHLADVDLALACSIFPKLFSFVTQLWLSEKNEVTTAATHTLEILLKDGLAAACETKPLVEQHQTKIAKCFETIECGLKYQFNKAWHQVLYIIGVMFEVGGENCKDMFLSCLKTLAELRDSYKFSYNNELEHTVGIAIRALGPETVLDFISLKNKNGELNLDRSWLLPVLKENIKISTLEYFLKGILPLALFCQKRSTQLAQNNDGIGAHSSELLYMQLWNLLPCFCISPTDIKENFKSIAKVLGTAISDRKELRLAVMASLRRLITYAKETDNKEDIQEIARFDKNYLPILFNLYTTKPIGSDEEGQRLAALDTIKLYLSIANSNLTQQLLNSAVERLNSSSEDPEDSFIKESILDLIRVLVPYQNMENIKMLYVQCIKPLPTIKNNKEQKKAYRLLEEICGSESECCKEFIKYNRKEVQSLLKKSLDSAVISSKGARLRCLNYLLKAQPHLDYESKLILSITPEAVLACKDVNQKTRAIAYQVLNTIGEILMHHNQIDKFIAIVIAGLTGHQKLISCTVLALASILHNFSGCLGKENIQYILENIAILISSSTREIVGSCLSFIKVFCRSLPSPMVASSIPQIIKAMVNMTEDCKRHFRLKTRDIFDRLMRKYGYETISSHIPVNDTVTYKRLKNLRKLHDRKKRQNQTNDEDDNDDDNEEFIIKAKPKTVEEILADSDSEFDDDLDDSIYVDKIKKKKNRINTWIEEDADEIIDFTDPNVAKKITATKPSQTKHVINSEKKEKNRGFKTASDGRLIITNDLSSDDEDNKKMSKLNLDSDSDSENNGDGRSIAETLVLSDRKRKRSSESVKSNISSSTISKMKYKTGGIGIHRPTTSNTKPIGNEYKSKKAKGDVKKKNKLEPYAYLPLKRSTMNKRKRKKAEGQFKTIVKAAKMGALKGAKAKKQQKMK